MRERSTQTRSSERGSTSSLPQRRHRTPEPRGLGESLARGLGWFSIALGVTETLAPQAVSRAFGLRHGRDFRVMHGFREIASGIGILGGTTTLPWLLARVGGDFVDLRHIDATSRRVRRRDKETRSKLAFARQLVLGATALDAIAAAWLAGAATKRSRKLRSVQHGQASITIGCTPEEVYGFFRDFENLPTFMAHLVSVETLDHVRTRWCVKAPAGTTVSWEAAIVKDRPGELIAWRSCEGADIDSSGTVRFVAAPGGRGTEVHVSLRYGAPGGKLGAALAKLFGEEPTMQIRGDLRRLKQVMETGEVVHSDASIHRWMHPAQPPEKKASAPNRKEMMS